MPFLVVHAHLYQPPRENPWTEMIHRQPSAAPFHDWNERVSDECYERLGAAAVADSAGKVYGLVNLFARLSFNIGPTLALWLERQRPGVLADARTGDAQAAKRGGGGPAMMQAYSHPILPLCEERERRLQIAWGLADFRRRFDRRPRGIWLPETAVDLATLEACAAAGLEYTILAPEQVLRIRPLDAPEAPWQDVSGGRVPTHRPLRVRLPSGRDLTVFVFNGEISRGVAFGGDLSSGRALLERLRGALEALPEPDGLVLLAADGETFGHHQRGAERSLAEALMRCRAGGLARVAHLGEVLDALPPTHEARLATPSAWSCPHGVGRWSTDCGCRMSDHPEGWSWQWRSVLRAAVSTLRDRIFLLIDRRGEEVLSSPWQALEDYGAVLARPHSRQALEALLARHLPRNADPAARQRGASLLELVRQTLFSATSCGWFFDDIAGLEAMQVLRHAARAAELCRAVFDVDVEPAFIARLRDAPVNAPGFADAAEVYTERVLPARHEPRVALAHHGLMHLSLALAGRSALAPVSRSFGLFAVDDLETPTADGSDGGQVSVSGRGRVTHLRTLEQWEGSFETLSEAPGEPVRVLIDQVPWEPSCTALREEALDIGARRAAALLPTASPEVLRQVGWAARDARALAAPLPPPMAEAISGGARALLSARLASASRPLAEEIEALSEALEAARGAGLEAADLAALRPALDLRLAYLVHTTLLRERQEVYQPLAALIEVARETAGDDVLASTRRTLASGAWETCRAAAEALGAAAAMEPEALTPADTPVRAISKEELGDALA